MSIGAASNNTKVPDYEMEIDQMMFFLCVICVIRKQEEITDYLKHELSKHPPSFVDACLMQNPVKILLAEVLKSWVTPVHTGQL